jgi:hypothetical protein
MGIEHQIELSSALVTDKVPGALQVLSSAIPEALSLELNRMAFTSSLVVHNVLV